MSRPLPRCAWCGAVLTRHGRVVLEVGDLPGRPSVGWCSGAPYACLRDDPAWRVANDPKATRDQLAEAVGVVEHRGAGRVVRARPNIRRVA